MRADVMMLRVWEQSPWILEYRRHWQVLGGKMTQRNSKIIKCKLKQCFKDGRNVLYSFGSTTSYILSLLKLFAHKIGGIFFP